MFIGLTASGLDGGEVGCPVSLPVFMKMGVSYLPRGRWGRDQNVKSSSWKGQSTVSRIIMMRAPLRLVGRAISWNGCVIFLSPSQPSPYRDDECSYCYKMLQRKPPALVV